MPKFEYVCHNSLISVIWRKRVLTVVYLACKSQSAHFDEWRHRSTSIFQASDKVGSKVIFPPRKYSTSMLWGEIVRNLTLLLTILLFHSCPCLGVYKGQARPSLPLASLCHHLHIVCIMRFSKSFDIFNVSCCLRKEWVMSSYSDITLHGWGFQQISLLQHNNKHQQLF